MSFLRSVILVSVIGLSAAALAAEPQGHHIKVTPEMKGAGIVSSGVKLQTPPPATGTEEHPVPSWGKPLPWPVIIADRRNNRLIEIAPDKRVIWEFPSPTLSIYRGNDDVYFSPDGNSLMVNEEDNFDIHIVDYASRQLAWSYGEADTYGRGSNQFNFPDDAHLLPDGSIVVADIRNCRVEFIDKDKAEVTQTWGQPGQCRHDPPRFIDKVNGVTPMANGNLMLTEIPGSWITEIKRDGTVVWAKQAPHVGYPSDAYPTHDGQVIVSDYAKPGGVVIFDRNTSKVTWEYRVKSGEGMLNHPSLAFELPNGDVILNDDDRHRVLVIDRQTKKIIWQYGQTDKSGYKPGFLFHPDGLDVDYYHDWKAALNVK